jgi:hypothetical protein
MKAKGKPPPKREPWEISAALPMITIGFEILSECYIEELASSFAKPVLTP